MAVEQQQPLTMRCGARRAGCGGAVGRHQPILGCNTDSTGASGGHVAEFPDEPKFLQAINDQGKDSLVETMGIVITSASADRVVATMPVEGNTQLTGILHGGASCVLAETLGSVASWLHAGPDSQVAGIEINA